MSNHMIPFSVGDFSSFARSVRRQLGERESIPGHVEMLNLLCKAGGYTNYQHFLASAGQGQEDVARSDMPSAMQPDTRPAPQSAPVDQKLIRKLQRLFDEQGRLIRWPGKYTHRIICLWALWSRIPARQTFTEQEISDLLDDMHLFGDYALLRREMADRSMLDRTPDGREYRRVEQQPPDEAVALSQALRSVE